MPAARPPTTIACGAISVATSAVPCVAMRAASASVRNTPCSMVSMPASRHHAMPSSAIAWAAARRRARCASSTPARNSSSVSCAARGSTPGVMTPPVATSLMTSAPARSCSRTARRRSSGPSACRPSIRQPWPPVMQTARPAQSSRGPAITPARTASRTAISAYSRPPRSRTVVTPASTVRRARTTALTTVAAYDSSVIVREGSASPERHRWT